MAILKGIFRKQTGSIGDMTLRVVNGQTVTSEKVTRNTSKSFAQMVRRVQWANLVNLFRSFEGTLHPSFESRPRTWSDFNAFISANIGQYGVYLTASEAAQGGCLVAPYQVTRGSLPSVGMGTTPAGVITSDIKLGSLVINDETTLAAFSAAVKANNSGWQYGDQLSAFVAVQKVNTVSQVPYVEVRAFEITLAEDDETLVVDLIGNDPTCFAVTDQKLCLNASINGGTCYVHSRKEGQKTRVSTQRFTVTNDLLDQYTTATKRSAAIVSYGGKVSTDFLTPNIDDVLIND